VDRVVGGETMKFADGELSGRAIDAASSFSACAHDLYCGYWQMRNSGIRAADY
jgi:hypothetical protein